MRLISFINDGREQIGLRQGDGLGTLINIVQDEVQ